MTDRNPAHATPLELPPAALNAPLHRKPHPDSEESVQYERQRVSRELEPYVHSSSRPSTDTSRPPRATPSFASLRSRNAAQRNSADPSQEHLARHDSTTSNATTQPDIPGASEAGRLSTRSFVKVPHWYDPIARFWTTHVCPSMDEGAYRDHLGTFISPSFPIVCSLRFSSSLTSISTRTHLPGLPAHLPHSRHDWHHNRPAISSSTQPKS